jgi:hypothetical protein
VKPPAARVNAISTYKDARSESQLAVGTPFDVAREERRARKTLRAYLNEKGTVTLDDAREKVGLFCNSYTRLATVIKLHTRRGLPRADLLTLLGDVWSGCDANGRTCNDLLQIILPDGAAAAVARLNIVR